MPNQYGEYTGTADRLQEACSGTLASFPIRILNSHSAFNPWLSTIQSFGKTDADLGAGTSSYAVLGSATLTAPGATPAPQDTTFTNSTGVPTTTEASIWSQPGMASPLSVQWVNTDNFLPLAGTLLVNHLVVLTGDPATFTDQYGPAILASLLLVPSESSIPLLPVPVPASLPILGSGLLGLLGLLMARRQA